MRSTGLRREFLKQNLTLHPKKAVYWEEEKALLIADLHIGKVGHFRKAGIAIPKLLEQEELATLSDLIREFNPSQVIFLGDLFHSEFNNDWNWLQLWRELFPKVKMILIQGNHDILHRDYYLEANFEIYPQLKLGPFLLLHDKDDFKSVLEEDIYILSGHVHPAVRLRGKARQSLMLSCFFFGKNYAILPAFGKFTGKCCLETEINDAIFGILDKSVIELQPF